MPTPPFLLQGAAPKPDAAAAASGRTDTQQAKRKADDEGSLEAKKPAMANASGSAPVKVRKNIDPGDFFAMGSSSGASSKVKAEAVPAAKVKAEAAVAPAPEAAAPPPEAAVAAKSPARPQSTKRARDEDDEGGEPVKAEQKAAPSSSAPKRSTPSAALAASTSPKNAAATTSSSSKTKGKPAVTSPADGAAAAPPPPTKWYPGKKDTAPPNKGNKRVPVAKANCLASLTFVITGTLDSLEREEAQALIEKYGGRVTGSVSGKTNYVLLGCDEHGAPMESSKVTKARTIPKCKLIDEDGFFDMLRETAPQPEEPEEEAMEEEEEPPLPPAALKPAVKAEGAAAASSSSGAGSSSSSSAAQPPPAPKEAREDAPPLWAEKYRPTSQAHLVGNADHVRRLNAWLQTWHAENAALEAAAGEKAKKGEAVFHKAALLSGPPGVGKTSTAKVLLTQLGYDVIELNASDTRSEKALKAIAVDMVGNTSISDFAGGKVGGTKKRLALIMDECDGMSAGDRGGMQALVGVIKVSKLPIICICNDRQSAKVKTLANYALDLRFRRPAAAEVKNALRRVVKNEGYQLEDGTLEKIAESCNSDIRQMLNLLQIWRPAAGVGAPAKSLTAADVTENLKSAFKDVDVGPFDVADKFFREPNSDFEKRLRHYFVDSSMTPLLVHENYLTVSPPPPPNLPPRQQHAWLLHRATLASDYMAVSDVIGNRIVKEQQWGLAPLHGALSCLAPGYMMQGNVPRLNFPSWLGRNSTANKRQRLLKELSGHMQHHISGSKEEVRQAYVPSLRPGLLRPLVERAGEGAEEVIGMLDEYGLTKDDFDSIMELELLVGPAAKPAITQVPTAAKAALTRKYNAAHQAMKKVGSSKGAAADLVRFTEDGDDDDGFIVADDEEGEEEEDFKPAAKKPAASKGKGKGKGKA